MSRQTDTLDQPRRGRKPRQSNFDRIETSENRRQLTVTVLIGSEPDQDQMLGNNFGLGILPPRTRTRPIEEPATPDTVLWIKDGFGDEQIDFGLWNRSHEMGFFDGEYSSMELLLTIVFPRKSAIVRLEFLLRLDAGLPR